MFIFEKDLDRKVQLLVFNVYGEYLYGYWVYIEERVQVGLSPCYEGILLFDYKKRDGGRCPVAVLTPNGNYEKNGLLIRIILVSLQKHISIALPIMK